MRSQWPRRTTPSSPRGSKSSATCKGRGCLPRGSPGKPPDRATPCASHRGRWDQVSELRTEETMREESQDDRGPASRPGIAALARDATIYGGTRVLLKSLAFLLVPLYAAFLSPTQF